MLSADADAESGQAYTNSGMGQQPWTLLRSYGSTLQPSVQSLVSPCSVADEPQTKSAVSTPDMACPHGNTWSRVRTRGLHRTAERGARTASQRLRSHPWPAAWPAAWQAEGQTAGKQPASLPCLASHPAIRSSKPGAVAAAARDRVPSGWQGGPACGSAYQPRLPTFPAKRRASLPCQPTSLLAWHMPACQGISEKARQPSKAARQWASLDGRERDG